MDRGRGYKVAGAKATRITRFVIKITGTRKVQPVCQLHSLLTDQVFRILKQLQKT